MNDDKIVHPYDDLSDDMYNKIEDNKIQQEETNHNSFCTLFNNKLQLSYDLEDLNKIDDWNSTNSHKGELVITYNNNTENNTLRQRIFYVLYIGPNNDGNGHLIYKLYIDQILVTMNYQSVPVPVPVPVPEDLTKEMNKIYASDNKIQIGHLNSNQSIVQDDYLITTKVTVKLQEMIKIILKIKSMVNQIVHNN